MQTHANTQSLTFFMQEARRKRGRCSVLMGSCCCYSAPKIAAGTHWLHRVIIICHFASPAIRWEHSFSFFFSIIYVAHRVNLESAQSSQASLILRLYILPVCVIIYCLLHYWPNGMRCSQVSEEGGGDRKGFITGREPLIPGWPHFMWDALQETGWSHREGKDTD